MENLKLIMDDLINIKECFFWIHYYTRLENDIKVQLYQEKINLIYRKHNIKGYNEMINKIEKEYKKIKISTDRDLCKNVLFLIKTEKSNEMEYADEVFKDIYKYIVTNNLYNPNWNIGASSETFYTLLPEIKELFETNLKVYQNSSIDWNILNNESDSLFSFIEKYINTKDPDYKNYYFKIIEIALNSGIDIDSTIRYKSESQKVKLSVAESIKEQILKTNNTSVKSLLKIKRR